MRISSAHPSRHLTAVESNGHSTPPSLPPVVFSAWFQGQTSHPSGELTAKFGIPYEQIPNFFKMLEFPGGVTFRVTCERVMGDEMPDGGWDDDEEDDDD